MYYSVDWVIMRQIAFVFLVCFMMGAAGQVLACQGLECISKSLKIAQQSSGSGLPGHVIRNIQRTYGGRVVGVTPQASGSANEIGVLGFSGNGGYGGGHNYYDVQVLKAEGRVVLLTVDGDSGNIVSVRE